MSVDTFSGSAPTTSGRMYRWIALALASAVPVNTDQGDASPHPTIPALVLIFTMAPGIDPSMSPTPCRRFILSGQRTRSTEIPEMRSSLMACPRRPVMSAERVQGQDFILDGAIHTIRLQVSSSSEAGVPEMTSEGRKRTVAVIGAGVVG